MDKQKMRVRYDVEAMEVTFDVFLNDAKVALTGHTFCFADLPTEGDIADRVSLYGLNKLLTDRTSDEKDKGAKLDKMCDVMAQLETGEWAKERVVGAPVVSVEVEALAQMKELSVPQAQAALAAYDKDVRAKILGSKEVQEVAQKIRETRAATEVVSLDDMVPVDSE